MSHRVSSRRTRKSECPKSQVLFSLKGSPWVIDENGP